MQRINRKSVILNLLVISFLWILIVGILVRFVLSKNEDLLFIVRFLSMILTMLMVIVSLVFIILFLTGLILKKKECFGKVTAIISAITILMTISIGILLKEESKYYHILNSNWDIKLPREYKEIYYKDSGVSFLGDGEKYSIFQYSSLDQIKDTIEWKNSNNDEIEDFAAKILNDLDVPKEYYPEINDNFLYYKIIRDDKSQMCIILNEKLKKAYILE